MNFFRFLGDFCHLFSIVILIYKIHSRQTTAGISLRTRVLYLLVFLARYGDLFLYYVSLYNTFMKILYLSTTGYIIYLMTISAAFKNTWYHDLDNFATMPLVVGALILALICTAKYQVFETMWTFSIILESVAILPQIDHLTKVPTLPALPLTHLVALGLYRFFYVVNWLVRFSTEGLWDLTAFSFGVVQTVIWVDFLVVWYYRKQIKLPPNRASSDEEGLVGGGQQVDESDMSSSFVITHIFALIRLFENRFMAGRRIPGLSVSAYPEQQIVRQGQDSSTSYSDEIIENTTPAQQQDAGEYVIRTPSPEIGHVDRVNDAGSAKKAVNMPDEQRAWQNSSSQGVDIDEHATSTGAGASAIAKEDGFEVDSDDGIPPVRQ